MKTTILTRASRSSFTCNPKMGRCGNIYDWRTEGVEFRGDSGKDDAEASAALADSAHGSLSEGLHAVLLYRSPENVISEPHFVVLFPSRTTCGNA